MMKSNDLDYVKDSCLRMLIEGRHTLMEEDLANCARIIGIDNGNGRFYCIVVKVLQDTGNMLPPYILGRVRSLVQAAIKTMSLKGITCISVHMDVVLLIYDSLDEKREIAQRVYEYISKRLPSKLCIGVGGTYRRLVGISISKEEAYEALSISGFGLSVVDIQDVIHIQDASNVAVSPYRELIINRFRNNQLEGIEKVLSELAELVRNRTMLREDAPYPSSIRRTMIELLVEVSRIASDSGIDVERILDVEDPYRYIFELACTPDIIKWVAAMMCRIRYEMEKRRELVESNLIEQAKEYIVNHLADIELGLGSVGASLGMSPSYFSAFFIKEMGIGFKEYVKKKRIELAIQYLVETSDSINEISEHCGFLSPSYFITVFKTQTGMTPGAYRKMKN